MRRNKVVEKTRNSVLQVRVRESRKPAVHVDDIREGASLSELATAQKIEPLKDLSLLTGGFPSDEDVNDFLEEIYSARK